LKKEYAAGPFPQFNCWLKNPRLARAVANEVLLLIAAQLEQSSPPCPISPGQTFPPIWLIAHSNGAHIALLISKLLIARGCWIGGIILTGAACEADVERNNVLPWLLADQLDVAIAYCSAEDQVLPWGNPLARNCAGSQGSKNLAARLWHQAWPVLAWPYGSLGRTGWLFRGEPVEPAQSNAELGNVRSRLITRWQTGGHSTWFTPENIERTFEQFYAELQQGVGH